MEVEPEPFGPFEDWVVQRRGQVFRLEGPEACFGDYGPLMRVRIRGAGLPEAFRLELTVDNSIYGGLLGFSRDPGAIEVPISNWVAIVQAGI